MPRSTLPEEAVSQCSRGCKPSSSGPPAVAERGEAAPSFQSQCNVGMDSVFKNTCVCVPMCVRACLCVCVHMLVGVFLFLSCCCGETLRPKAAQEGYGKRSFDIRLSAEVRGKFAGLAS